MKTIVFGTMKGGTGKTSVSFNVGGILAEKHKVLFIDVDPQANLSNYAGVDITIQDAPTVRDVFSNPRNTTAKQVITKAPIPQLPNLDIIASHILLTVTEFQLVSTAGRELILQKWMKRNMDVLRKYDYIIFDTNPSMGIVNQNAFMVADKIILVSDVSQAALQGAQLFMYHWGEVCENMDIENKTGALILNNYDARTNLGGYIKDYYKDDTDFVNLFLDTIIPYRADIKRTGIEFLPINLTAPKSESCDAFRRVVNELKERKVL